MSAPSEEPARAPAPGSISVFFPAYHDWGTIASQVVLVSRTLRELTDDWEVIVVDDGSRDRTPEVLDELTKLCPRLRVVTHAKNRGYGGALRSGFEAARKEWIFYTDGDAQYDVCELTLLWAARDGVDLVNGFKIARSDPFHRILIGRLYHWMIKLAFGLRTPDVDCDFRLVRRAVFEKIELTRDTGLICVELVTKIEKSGFRSAYVPVHHYHRLHGRSQFFNLKRVGQVAIGLGELWRELILEQRIGRA
ncbi:MAG: glycosyltransferase family 2 protein [Myxococcota bacterium]|nr:glycosyltransferase family 2 protein [Myxococcota bacterium]